MSETKPLGRETETRYEKIEVAGKRDGNEYEGQDKWPYNDLG